MEQAYTSDSWRGAGAAARLRHTGGAPSEKPSLTQRSTRWNLPPGFPRHVAHRGAQEAAVAGIVRAPWSEDDGIRGAAGGARAT